MSRLPSPVAEVWDWQLRAACRDRDSATFFNPDFERGSCKADRDNQAKAICVGCPVIDECRRHALAVREPYGVWGGLTADERLALPPESWDSANRLNPAVHTSAHGAGDHNTEAASNG